MSKVSIEIFVSNFSQTFDMLLCLRDDKGMLVFGKLIP